MKCIADDDDDDEKRAREESYSFYDTHVEFIERDRRTDRGRTDWVAVIVSLYIYDMI